MAGIAVSICDVRREATEMRHARARDANRAAPSILDTRRAELRKDAQHARSDDGRDILRYVPVAFAAGEQQSIVCALAIVIEHMPGVGDSGIVRKNVQTG